MEAFSWWPDSDILSLFGLAPRVTVPDTGRLH